MRWRERAAVATSGASAQQPFISNVSVRTLHHQVASENRAWCFLPRRGAARVFKSWSALPFDGERRGKARRGQVQYANSPMRAECAEYAEEAKCGAKGRGARGGRSDIQGRIVPTAKGISPSLRGSLRM